MKKTIAAALEKPADEIPLTKMLRDALHAAVVATQAQDGEPFGKATRRTLGDPFWAAAYAVSVLPESWLPMAKALEAIEENYDDDHPARTLLASLIR